MLLKNGQKAKQSKQTAYISRGYRAVAELADRKISRQPNFDNFTNPIAHQYCYGCTN